MSKAGPEVLSLEHGHVKYFCCGSLRKIISDAEGKPTRSVLDVCVSEVEKLTQLLETPPSDTLREAIDQAEELHYAALADGERVGTSSKPSATSAPAADYTENRLDMSSVNVDASSSVVDTQRRLWALGILEVLPKLKAVLQQLQGYFDKGVLRSFTSADENITVPDSFAALLLKIYNTVHTCLRISEKLAKTSPSPKGDNASAIETGGDSPAGPSAVKTDSEVLEEIEAETRPSSIFGNVIPALSKFFRSFRYRTSKKRLSRYFSCIRGFTILAEAALCMTEIFAEAHNPSYNEEPITFLEGKLLRTFSERIASGYFLRPVGSAPFAPIDPDAPPSTMESVFLSGHTLTEDDLLFVVSDYIVALMNIKSFFHEFGHEYVAGLRTFLTLMVQVAASQGVAVSASRSQNSRNLIFNLASAYYMVTHDRAVDKMHEVMDDMDIDLGRAIWNCYEANSFAVLFNYFTLPSIQTDISFSMDVTSLFLLPEARRTHDPKCLSSLPSDSDLRGHGGRSPSADEENWVNDFTLGSVVTPESFVCDGEKDGEGQGEKDGASTSSSPSKSSVGIGGSMFRGDAWHQHHTTATGYQRIRCGSAYQMPCAPSSYIDACPPIMARLIYTKDIQLPAEWKPHNTTFLTLPRTMEAFHFLRRDLSRPSSPSSSPSTPADFEIPAETRVKLSEIMSKEEFATRPSPEINESFGYPHETRGETGESASFDAPREPPKAGRTKRFFSGIGKSIEHTFMRFAKKVEHVGEDIKNVYLRAEKSVGLTPKPLKPQSPLSKSVGADTNRLSIAASDGTKTAALPSPISEAPQGETFEDAVEGGEEVMEAAVGLDGGVVAAEGDVRNGVGEADGSPQRGSHQHVRSASSIPTFEVEEEILESLEPQPESKPKKLPGMRRSLSFSFKRWPSSDSVQPSQSGDLCDALVIHIHGGGFISMTSFGHESYLRQWSLQLNVPVFSIDYRLAPEFPFPIPAEECYRAYVWAVTNCKHLGSRGRKIVLIGDSAGGNLVCSVIFRCILTGFRRPDAAILVYPNTHAGSAFSPSRLVSILDPMVNRHFLRVAKKAYVQSEEHNPFTDPTLSPTVAPDRLLRRFPKTLVVVGNLDPLYDDAAMFAQHVNRLTGKVTLHVWDGLGHGFMNIPQFVRETDEVNKRIVDWIRDVIRKPHRRPMSVSAASAKKPEEERQSTRDEV